MAVIELTEVRVTRLGDVDRDHARAEGEGDDTLAVLERFRLVETL